MNETPTPRTDAETLEFIRLDPSGSYVDAYFACDLERELSAATAACAAKDAALLYVSRRSASIRLAYFGQNDNGHRVFSHDSLDVLDEICAKVKEALSTTAGQELSKSLSNSKNGNTHHENNQN